MMNAYFFQMNNLKGLAADESGSSCAGRETSQVRALHSLILWRLDFLCIERKNTGDNLDNSLPHGAGDG